MNKYIYTISNVVVTCFLTFNITTFVEQKKYGFVVALTACLFLFLFINYHILIKTLERKDNKIEQENIDNSVHGIPIKTFKQTIGETIVEVHVVESINLDLGSIAMMIHYYHYNLKNELLFVEMLVKPTYGKKAIRKKLREFDEKDFMDLLKRTKEEAESQKETEFKYVLFDKINPTT